jgi:hypothetical protein
MITNIFLATMILTAVVGYDIAHTEVPPVKAQEVVESPVASPEPTTAPIPEDIVGYINYKFGEDAEKAFKVLNCENKTLNPKALNDNTEWGGIGKDRGYWQINDIFHPSVSDWCASDVKCSTDYAYRMYMNDNKSFVRWTCGRK